MIEHTLPVTLKLTGKAGLDPRVAAEFAMTAAQFDGDITVTCHGRTVSAKSVAQVMALGAVHNDLVALHAEGEHAQHAVNALIAVIQK